MQWSMSSTILCSTLLAVKTRILSRGVHALLGFHYVAVVSERPWSTVSPVSSGAGRGAWHSEPDSNAMFVADKFFYELMRGLVHYIT